MAGGSQGTLVCDDGFGGGWHQSGLSEALGWASVDSHAGRHRLIECLRCHGHRLLRGGPPADGVMLKSNDSEVFRLLGDEV